LLAVKAGECQPSGGNDNMREEEASIREA